MCTDNNIQNIGVRQLTLKEREKLFLEFEETIKSRKRKEFIELSKVMDPKEKIKFLVECANTNRVTTEEVIEESQTVNGISSIFKVTSDKQLNWIEVLTDESTILPVLKAYYYSLGIEVPEEVVEDITQLAAVGSNEAPKQEQADFFPVTDQAKS